MKLMSLTVEAKDVKTNERSPACWRIRPAQGLGENVKNTENERERTRTRKRKRKADRPTAPSTEFNQRNFSLSQIWVQKKTIECFLKY